MLEQLCQSLLGCSTPRHANTHLHTHTHTEMAGKGKIWLKTYPKPEGCALGQRLWFLRLSAPGYSRVQSEESRKPTEELAQG